MTATTTFRVLLSDGGTRVVTAADKDAAAAAALTAAADAATAYNARYGASLDANGVGWAKADASRLTVVRVRKAAARK